MAQPRMLCDGTRKKDDEQFGNLNTLAILLCRLVVCRMPEYEGQVPYNVQFALRIPSTCHPYIQSPPTLCYASTVILRQSISLFS